MAILRNKRKNPASGEEVALPFGLTLGTKKRRVAKKEAYIEAIEQARTDEDLELEADGDVDNLDEVGDDGNHGSGFLGQTNLHVFPQTHLRASDFAIWRAYFDGF